MFEICYEFPITIKQFYHYHCDFSFGLTIIISKINKSDKAKKYTKTSALYQQDTKWSLY